MLSTRLACSVAAFICLTAASASAQPSDKRTIFTFSGPVSLPGITLPAGQYLFRLADTHPTADVVQVLSADGTTPYGLFLTIPADRGEPASAPEIGFRETVSGAPAAIQTWWYPGERFGYEFLPRRRNPGHDMAASVPAAASAEAVAADRSPSGEAAIAPLIAGSAIDGTARPSSDQ